MREFSTLRPDSPLFALPFQLPFSAGEKLVPQPVPRSCCSYLSGCPGITTLRQSSVSDSPMLVSCSLISAGTSISLRGRCVRTHRFPHLEIDMKHTVRLYAVGPVPVKDIEAAARSTAIENALRGPDLEQLFNDLRATGPDVDSAE